ncbi:proline iminopeptidase [Mycolicibacterium madagascariense]|uniref:Proline iminopeptidase n=1 Tax=Mycolicibacterium madagascariense TaxID=212765 RepID=A0A7I7XCM4_9MYCO|nr:prolyl aminopeptidase [Mycolicibacterium madagascariense]BBZ27085.1 proline iminopeptidase [Mycolicibacterium madagascariense]
MWQPEGIPAVALHGGPGSGCVPGMRQLFDPAVYRIVLFDQRGCGRSTPHAADHPVDLSANTTHHLIADIELLREHLGVSRWLVVGWSWGTTLALAYAERHPTRVSGLALTAVTTTGPREVEWITRTAGCFFPAQWARFRDAVPAEDRDGSLAEAYARLLHDDDPEVREKAARDWCDWEASHVDIDGQRPPPPRYADPRYRMCFARLVTHYWRHAAWLPDGELLRNVDRIAHLPAVLIHGRLDLSGPPDVAWQLAQSWPAARLHVVEGVDTPRAASWPSTSVCSSTSSRHTNPSMAKRLSHCDDALIRVSQWCAVRVDGTAGLPYRRWLTA